MGSSVGLSAAHSPAVCGIGVGRRPFPVRWSFIVGGTDGDPSFFVLPDSEVVDVLDLLCLLTTVPSPAINKQVTISSALTTEAYSTVRQSTAQYDKYDIGRCTIAGGSQSPALALPVLQ